MAFKAGQTVINVKDFGAKGDGAAVDTAAIQLAIDAVNIAGGGTVLFPPGTYVTGALTLKAGVSLAGQGATASTTVVSDGSNWFVKAAKV